MKQQALDLFGGGTIQVGYDGERRDADYYPTPTWCTEALVPHLAHRIAPRADRQILEPGIGHGAVARVLVAEGYGVHGIDVRPEAVAECQAAGLSVELADFNAWTPEGPLAGIVGNPPYSEALGFCERALWILEHCSTPLGVSRPVLAFLLSLDFLASIDRGPFWRRHPADVVVLDRRPSFTGSGSAFSFYGWFIWPSARPVGRILRQLP